MFNNHQDDNNSQEWQRWQPESTHLSVEEKKETDISSENEINEKKAAELLCIKNFSPISELIDVANVANVATFDLSESQDAVAENIDSAKAIINDALLHCMENPSVLFSDSFIEAVKIIRGDKGLWADYRVKIKQSKPSGVQLKEIDEATKPYVDAEFGNESTAAQLIDMVMNSGDLFYDDISENAFVTVFIDGITHTLAIGSKTFIEWLSYAYFKKTQQDSGGLGFSANEQAIKQAGFALSGIAKHDGEKQRIHLRVADHNGGHYLFIGDDENRVIEVLPTGWRIISNPPVKFWKPSSMQAIPIPQIGGDLSRLWDFINIKETDRPLLLAWMLDSLREESVNLILSLSGLDGSAKSASQSKIRDLIDSNVLNLRAAPKTIEDIFVGAGCNWLVSYENISHLSSRMQDALCTITTGGGFAGRTLHTNAEETLIKVKRPVIINSIPKVITAQDATARTICLDLPPLTNGYIDEGKINAAWESAKPEIFGALLDLFVKSLEILPSIKLTYSPRMIGFVKLGEAICQVLGHESGYFSALYNENHHESLAAALESSPAAVAICELVDSHQGQSTTVFHGTVKSLYEKLKVSGEGFPKSPKGFSEAIKRQTRALKSVGIEILQSGRVERINGERGLTITVKKILESGNVGNVGNVVPIKTLDEKKIQSNSAAFLNDDVEVF
jgi:hypothetical protein